MRKLAPILVALFVAATVACSTEQPTGSGAPSATPAPVAPAPSTSAGTQAAPEEATLLLEIASPQDESVVTTASIEISGQTEPDAVVSINGSPVEVSGDGRFSATVALEEGPNAIEVVASTFQSRKASRVLTVISNPS